MHPLCIGFAALNQYAEKKFHELNDQYRKYIALKPEKCRKQYSDIVADGDEISKHNFTLPETISAKVESDGTEFHDHLFANREGIAKIKLNGWELAVLTEEQKRPDYVCWVRNPPRQSWSLRIPYEIEGKYRELYPDFLIVREDPDLGYLVDILEPHNPGFKDNLGKAKGLAEYAANEPRIDRIQLIRVGKDAAGNNRFKRLNLAIIAYNKKKIENWINRIKSTNFPKNQRTPHKFNEPKDKTNELPHKLNELRE